MIPKVDSIGRATDGNVLRRSLTGVRQREVDFGQVHHI